MGVERWWGDFVEIGSHDWRSKESLEASGGRSRRVTASADSGVARKNESFTCQATRTLMNHDSGTLLKGQVINTLCYCATKSLPAL